MMLLQNRNLTSLAIGGLLLLVLVGAAGAADIKTLGRLNIPANAAVISVCTDPVVQGVLSEDLRGHPRSGPPVVVTVTVNAKPLAPGVSIQDLSPGDPSVAEMLKAMGAEPPLLGDTGTKPSEDSYTIQARRQALLHEDAQIQQFRGYIARRSDMDAGGPSSPYDNIPDNEMYQTAIVARASIADSPSEFKVVALVLPGDDVRSAKKQVAEEIANAILH